MKSARRYVSSGIPERVHVGTDVWFGKNSIRAVALCGAVCDEILATWETPGTPADNRMVNCFNCKAEVTRLVQELRDAMVGER